MWRFVNVKLTVLISSWGPTYGGEWENNRSCTLFQCYSIPVVYGLVLARERVMGPQWTLPWHPDIQAIDVFHRLDYRPMCRWLYWSVELHVLWASYKWCTVKPKIGSWCITNQRNTQKMVLYHRKLEYCFIIMVLWFIVCYVPKTILNAHMDYLILSLW